MIWIMADEIETLKLSVDELRQQLLTLRLEMDEMKAMFAIKPTNISSLTMSIVMDQDEAVPLIVTSMGNEAKIFAKYYLDDKDPPLRKVKVSTSIEYWDGEQWILESKQIVTDIIWRRLREFIMKHNKVERMGAEKFMEIQNRVVAINGSDNEKKTLFKHILAKIR